MTTRRHTVTTPPETALAIIAHSGWPAVFVALAWGFGGTWLAVALPAVDPRYDWTDGFYWAAMILTGMGPPDIVPGEYEAVKWFLSFYAVFSGVIFLGGVTYSLQPIFHRVLAAFHLPEDA